MDRSVDASTKVHLVNIHGWRGYNNPWCLEEETDSEYSYINLLANPERYTGYKVQDWLLSREPLHLASCFHLCWYPTMRVLQALHQCKRGIGAADNTWVVAD